MGRTCSTHGENRHAYRILVEREHYEGLHIGGRIILKWMLE
jgi:hypothetical protein